jgi:hypothetical protein
MLPRRRHALQQLLIQFVHLLELAALVPDVIQGSRREGAPRLLARVTCQYAIKWPEEHQIHGCALAALGRGLEQANQTDQALEVCKANLARTLRVMPPCDNVTRIILSQKGNIAALLHATGKLDEATEMSREIYAGLLALSATEPLRPSAALNLAVNLFNNGRRRLDQDEYAEVKSLLRTNIPYARRMLGNDHLITTNMAELLSVIIIDEVQQHRDAADPSEDLLEAVTTLEDLCKRGRRIFGATHPQTLKFEKNLKLARKLIVSIARGG